MDDTLSKANATLERVRLQEVKRVTKRATGRAGRAAKISTIGVAAILLAAFIWGLVMPIGTTGVMIAVLAMLAAIVIGVLFSREAEVQVETLRKVDLKTLPHKTARWLDGQRPALPAPATRLVDGIGVKLETLGPQLQSLDEREPAAAAIRRLIGDELPELVKGYQRVPDSLKKSNIDGIVPEKQLLDGLQVVDGELSRMSEQLARGDLQKLATQGKYLELKYQGGDL